jgi:hypothetical protein
MIHNMWNSQTFGTDFLSGPRPREWDILHDNLITRLFRERMPSHWDVELQVSEARPGPDAILSMSPAADINIPVFIEVKGTVEPRDIPRLVDQLNSYSEERPHLVVAPTSDEIAARSVTRGLDYLKRLFGDESAAGSELAVEALSGIEDETSIRRSCDYLTRELLEELGPER